MSRESVLYYCEWPDCRAIASHRIRRGEDMKSFRVCPRHRREFHGLAQLAAWKVHARRQDQRRVVANFWHLGCLPRIPDDEGRGG